MTGRPAVQSALAKRHAWPGELRLVCFGRGNKMEKSSPLLGSLHFHLHRGPMPNQMAHLQNTPFQRKDFISGSSRSLVDDAKGCFCTVRLQIVSVKSNSVTTRAIFSCRTLATAGRSILGTCRGCYCQGGFVASLPRAVSRSFLRDTFVLRRTETYQILDSACGSSRSMCSTGRGIQGSDCRVCQERGSRLAPNL
jgi:hypothetical protein